LEMTEDFKKAKKALEIDCRAQEVEWQSRSTSFAHRQKDWGEKIQEANKKIEKAETKLKGIEECFFKITFFGYSEAALRKMQFVAQLGLAGTEPVDVGGVRVRPRDVLLALLRQAPQAKEKPQSQGHKDVATVATGSQGGSAVVLRADTSGGPNPEWGVSGGTLLVAAAPAIVARWLASGRLGRPGVWAPEQAIEPEPFFAELARRGFTTTLTRTETVAEPA